MGPGGTRSPPQERAKAADRTAPDQVRRRINADYSSSSQHHPLTSAHFPRSHRITRGTELRAVARTGKRLRTEHLDVRVSASLSRLGHLRVGIVVPKHRKSSVERNLLKRRLREITRTILLEALSPVDMVIHARASAYQLTFAELLEIAAQISREVRKTTNKVSGVD